MKPPFDIRIACLDDASGMIPCHMHSPLVQAKLYPDPPNRSERAWGSHGSEHDRPLGEPIGRCFATGCSVRRPESTDETDGAKQTGMMDSDKVNGGFRTARYGCKEAHGGFRQAFGKG